jgi:DNA-directed RNA polymerase subunit E'/Rpb7
MEPYFKKHKFIETMVVLPIYLDHNLFENLRQILVYKYPKTYLNKGYIFNIKVLQILENSITLSGQIVLTVEFEADIYLPQINHIFQGQIQTGSANKHQWVEIGPLTIFINSKGQSNYENNSICAIKITNIKSDNTLCFGQII